MSWDEIAVPDLLRMKSGGYFTVERAGTGFIITVHRPIGPEETIRCGSAGEANRLRQALSDEGLAGYIEGGL